MLIFLFVQNIIPSPSLHCISFWARYTHDADGDAFLFTQLLFTSGTEAIIMGLVFFSVSPLSWLEVYIYIQKAMYIVVFSFL